jgi:hypothetical protein
MHLNPKKLILLTLPLAPLVVIVAQALLRGPVTSRLEGTWRVHSDKDATTLTTFKANGQYQDVTTFSPSSKMYAEDGSGPGVPLVFKGSYSVDANSVRLFNFKRYTREDGVDIPFVPNGNTLNDAEKYSIDSYDKSEARKGIVIRLRWLVLGSDKIVATSTSNLGGAPRTTTDIWTRQ